LAQYLKNMFTRQREQPKSGDAECLVVWGVGRPPVRSQDANSPKPPVIVLGGDANALSVARTLSRIGVQVYALNFADRLLRYSRACRWIDLGKSNPRPEDWESFLLGPESDHLRGAVILACNDDAIEIIIRSGERLREKFILEEADSEVRRWLLDKLSTYRLAQEAGIPVPRYWQASTVSELEALEKDLVFPLILKPKLSHKFQKIWSVYKYFRADDIDAVYKCFNQTKENEIEVVLMELIPGDDDKDCSYYVYMGDNGEPLVELTKKCIRRCPPNMGGECYGITDWNPHVRELGLRFFRHVKFKGVGQIQFKLDERDGKHKIIECNARFAAPTCLVKASGVDLARVAYDRLTGNRQLTAGKPGDYVRGLRWWLPIDDFHAYLLLSRAGKLTFWRWIASVLRPHVLPVFRWNDPMPSIVGLWRRAAKLPRSLLRVRPKEA
jgi:D-aspartate ligase